MSLRGAMATGLTALTMGMGTTAMAADALTEAQQKAVQTQIEATLQEPGRLRATLSQAVMDRMIADFLRRHPEAVVAALQAVEQRRKLGRMLQAIQDNRAWLTEGHPEMGNPEGDVTAVAFVDYACESCRETLTALHEAVAADGDTRLVLIDTPWEGDVAVEAARAALAARGEGVYAPVHQRLLGVKGPMSSEAVKKQAVRGGLSAAALEKTAQAPGVTDRLKANADLVRRLGLGRLPAIVIGDDLILGPAPRKQITEVIAKQRQSDKGTGE